MPIISIALLLVTSIATAASQTLFKRALTMTGVAPGGGVEYGSFFIRLLMLPSFLIALFLYGSAFLLWIYLLSRTQLSIIYPIGIALNVIITLAATRYFLGEALSLSQVLGVLIIFAGIFIVTH